MTHMQDKRGDYIIRQLAYDRKRILEYLKRLDRVRYDKCLMEIGVDKRAVEGELIIHKWWYVLRFSFSLSFEIVSFASSQHSKLTSLLLLLRPRPHSLPSFSSFSCSPSLVPPSSSLAFESPLPFLTFETPRRQVIPKGKFARTTKFVGKAAKHGSLKGYKKINPRSLGDQGLTSHY